MCSKDLAHFLDAMKGRQPSLLNLSWSVFTRDAIMIICAPGGGGYDLSKSPLGNDRPFLVSGQKKKGDLESVNCMHKSPWLFPKGPSYNLWYKHHFKAFWSMNEWPIWCLGECTASMFSLGACVQGDFGWQLRDNWGPINWCEGFFKATSYLRSILWAPVALDAGIWD